MSEHEEAAVFLAGALRKLVNAPLPEDLDPEREFWVAARNARATLSVFRDMTGVDGDQEPPEMKALRRIAQGDR
jgi:hypothetical protein